MKTLIVCLCIAVTVLAPFSAPAIAQTTYIGPNGGSWNEPTHWNNGKPTPSVPAIIPGGMNPKTCEIPDTVHNAEALSVTIEEGATLRMEDASTLAVSDEITVKDGGTMRLKPGSSENDRCAVSVQWLEIEEGGQILLEDYALMTLGAEDAPNTSTIDGVLEIGDFHDPASSAKLIIAGNHTFEGPGGKVAISKPSVVTHPDNEDPTLTLASNCQDQQSPDCAILFHGGGEIKVRLVNNAIVRADLPWAGNPARECPMVLQDKPKSGSGLWSALGDGWLIVDENTEVTGAANWLLSLPTQNHEPVIEIKSCLYNLSGNVTILGGEFRFFENFCTSGNLLVDSDDYDGRFGAGNAVARFRVTCTASMCQ